MLRLIIIVAAALLAVGGVAFALSRPDMGDPGPPVILESDPDTNAHPTATPGLHNLDDTPGDDSVRSSRGGSGDDFRVAAPKAIKADHDDWDDDDGWDDDDDDWDDD